jgi:hypothetical protein
MDDSPSVSLKQTLEAQASTRGASASTPHSSRPPVVPSLRPEVEQECLYIVSQLRTRNEEKVSAVLDLQLAIPQDDGTVAYADASGLT